MNGGPKIYTSATMHSMKNPKERSHENHESRTLLPAPSDTPGENYDGQRSDRLGRGDAGGETREHPGGGRGDRRVSGRQRSPANRAPLAADLSLGVLPWKIGRAS